VTVGYLALAVATISLTISKGVIFRSTRDWIAKHSEWFGSLVRCPYCLAHWLAFGGVAIYRLRLVHSNVALVDYFVSAMVVIALATMIIGLMWMALVQLVKEH
jgi:hypothetical protein